MQGDSSNYSLNKMKQSISSLDGDSSSHSLVPLMPCSTTAYGEANYNDNKKISIHHYLLGCNALLSEAGEVREEPGYCGEQPMVIPWLSELPDHVVSLILCFLPIEEAARTCVLSKRWRYLWSYMLNIRLPVRASADTTTAILKLLNSSCVSFHLNLIWLLGRLPRGQEFDSWFSLACSRRMEELEFKLDFCNGARGGGPCKPRIRYWFTLPTSPGLSTLKRLTLGYCMLGPPASQCLTSLKYLILDRVQLEENMVEELTSSCPMLEDLELRECNSNLPFKICITNPKIMNLIIHDLTFNKPLIPILKLRAPYLSTLVLVGEARRRYQLNVPSLSTLKFSKFDGIDMSAIIPSLPNILSELDLRKLFLGSTFLFNLSRECCIRKLQLDLRPFVTTKVKQLHIQIKNLIQDLPGLVYLLPSFDGVETIVLNFEDLYPIRTRGYRRKYLRHLCCTTTKESSQNFVVEEEVDEEEEKAPRSKYSVLLADKGIWSALRIFLSCKMPDLKCLVINGFKRIKQRNIGKEYFNSCDLSVEDCLYLIDKDELKLLKVLLRNSLTLENISIRIKDVYMKDEFAIDSKRTEDVDMKDESAIEMIDTEKCQKIYLDGEIDKMDIPLWYKVVLSLPRGSARAKVNVTNL